MREQKSKRIIAKQVEIEVTTLLFNSNDLRSILQKKFDLPPQAKIFVRKNNVELDISDEFPLIIEYGYGEYS